MEPGHLLASVREQRQFLERPDVIMQLMCNLDVRFSEIEAAHAIRFVDAFEPELERLREFERDGLVMIGNDRLQVLAPGRMLVRNIAMVFDRYSKTPSPGRHSSTV
jgi:oxygen-independent coproporphyrinogen-3 oxidase